MSIEKIETAVRNIILERSSNVVGIYGFGSFFRAQAHNDIDIMIVVDCPFEELLGLYEECVEALSLLGTETGEEFHLLFLTYQEFKEKPLIESGSLIPIFTGS